MPLNSFIPGQIWLHAYPVRLAGTRFDARMTVIRLANGELVIHSPCSVTPEIAREIVALGSVAHIVAPGNFHHMHIASAQLAFPDARTWICPGVEKKRPELRFDEILGDVSPPEWQAELDQLLVTGARIMREVVMYHRASRTLILVDLIENFTDATPGTGGGLKFWFKYVLRMWNRPAPAPEYNLCHTDRKALARALERILLWDFRQIIVAHGDLIDHDAVTVARRAWAHILRL